MKKRKIFKKITLASLAACMFCLPILAGCTPAEMLPQNPGPGQNFDLGLNPETDPVVFTTASGLEIKKSNAKLTNSTTTVATNTGYTVTQDLTSFYYFTMGKFSGTIYTAVNGSLTANYTVTNEPVNWLIIGRGDMPVADNTPAGSAIQGEVGKQEIAVGNSMYECINFSSIPQHSDIPEGCFLVLSEKLLGQMYFNSNGILNNGMYTNLNYAQSYFIIGGERLGNRYRFAGDVNASEIGGQSWNNKTTDGSLYTYINNLFSKNTSGTILKNGLGFTQAQADLIVPQQLYTFYANGTGYPYAETPSTDGGTYYTMFPLAYRAAHSATKQNFCIEDYLTTNAQRVGTLIGSNQSYFWGLRSGLMSNWAPSVHYVLPLGQCGGDGVNHSNGVRPAMVMKLA